MKRIVKGKNSFSEDVVLMIVLDIKEHLIVWIYWLELCLAYKKRVEAPPDRILGKISCDSDRFSKQNQLEVKSKQGWWRFVQKIIIQNHFTRKEARTREQDGEAGGKKLRNEGNGNKIETNRNSLEIYGC